MIEYTTNKEMEELDKMLRKRYPSAYVKYQEKNKMVEIKRREKREKSNKPTISRALSMNVVTDMIGDGEEK